MANEENLIPFDERTESEQREIQSKGGKASGAARRRKKAMRQAASMLLGMEVPTSGTLSETLKNRLAAFGYSGDDTTFQDVLLASVLLEALKGDVRAAEFMRDTAGESPALEVRKTELKLRKEELNLRRQQQAGGGVSKTENNLLEAIMGAGEVDADDLPEVE